MKYTRSALLITKMSAIKKVKILKGKIRVGTEW